MARYGLGWLPCLILLSMAILITDTFHPSNNAPTEYAQSDRFFQPRPVPSPSSTVSPTRTALSLGQTVTLSGLFLTEYRGTDPQIINNQRKDVPIEFFQLCQSQNEHVTLEFSGGYVIPYDLNDQTVDVIGTVTWLNPIDVLVETIQQTPLSTGAAVASTEVSTPADGSLLGDQILTLTGKFYSYHADAMRIDGRGHQHMFAILFFGLQTENGQNLRLVFPAGQPLPVQAVDNAQIKVIGRFQACYNAVEVNAIAPVPSTLSTDVPTTRS